MVVEQTLKTLQQTRCWKPFPSSPRRRSSHRVAGGFIRGKLEFQRRRKAREDATRLSQSAKFILPPGSATTVSPDEPKSSRAKVGGGAARLWCYNDVLHGEAGWISQQQRPCYGPLDSSPCNGFRYGWGRPWMQGVFGPSGDMPGTGFLRRELERGIFAIVVGNAPCHCVHRKSPKHARSREALQSAGSAAMGCLCFVVHERGGSFGDQKDRTPEFQSCFVKGCPCQDGRCRHSGFTQSQKKTKVSEEAKRVTRPEVVLMKDSLVSHAVVDSLGPSSHDAGNDMNFCSEGEAPPFVSSLPPIDTLQDLSRSAGKCTPPQNKPKHESSSSKVQMLSYARWCSTLVPEVLKTRTPFGAFLSRTIHLSKRLSSDVAPTFFPLPIPPGYWHEMPASSSAQKRRSIHRSRALHVIVMALNFWHSGGSFPEDHQLQRAPNKLHHTLFKRIRALLRSDGPACAFEATKAGRRFPELITRLGELSDILTKNGCSISPYEKGFQGIEIPKDNSVLPELQPYRDLDPERLVVSGRGTFDATPHLSDPLVMPYREPAVLSLKCPVGTKPFMRDHPETIARLARVWDDQGLLYVHRFAVDPDRYVRIFNAYKSTAVDRQIGDRRGANSLEARISEFGPSSCLPSSSDFSEIALDPRRQTLSICITDRKDFYHQFWVSRRKALLNTLGPTVNAELWEGCPTYSLFALDFARRKYSREKHGDFLHGKEGQSMLPGGQCHVAFRSLLQGDHCGVDIATDSHTNVLQEAGLLCPSSMLVATKPLRDPNLCQGLVIDDYFAISVETAGTRPNASQAFNLYEKSQKLYEQYNLAGSPNKDILGDDCGKVIGAWVNSSKEARARGLVTVSSPAQKRLGLSHVSLKVAQLSSTSDSLHLCLVGGWVSAMGFRRPTYSLFSECFRLIDNDRYDPDNPKVVILPRRVANELVLAAVLHPLMMTDLGSKYHDRVFATDASSYRGAICSCPVSPLVAEVFWKTSKSKGSYTRLLTPSEELLRRLGIHEDVEDTEVYEAPVESGPNRPLAYRFDFIEVYAGSSGVTRAIQALGISVGPPIELSFSEEYDVSQQHVISWLSFLVEQRLVLGIMVEPPCTTFSIIRRPALRSRDEPYGFQPRETKTLVGNTLAARACQLMKIAGVNRVAGLLETPFSSLLKHLPAWKSVMAMPCSSFVRVDSCRFRSPHLKSFRMLCVHLQPIEINKQCVCTTKHLQVQGKYTKASASYTPELCAALALDFAAWIRAEKGELLEDSRTRTKGLESLAVNELALAGDWGVDVAWNFRKDGHINLLEEAALLRLAQRCAHLRFPTRITALVDSNVVRGATSKGRSSSLGLTSVLRRFNAVCVAAALYFHIAFVPTRLNVADDPSRNTMLRDRVPGFGLEKLSRDQLFDLCTLPRLKRWASNWARLIVLTGGLHLIYLSRRDIYREDFSRCIVSSQMDFDQTLGYPGEGPVCFRCVLGALGFLPLLVACPVGSPSLFLTLVVLRRFACWSPWFVLLSLSFSSMSLGVAMAMPVFPTTTGEVQKAASRRAGGPLPEGRPVLGDQCCHLQVLQERGSSQLSSNGRLERVSILTICWSSLRPMPRRLMSLWADTAELCMTLAKHTTSMRRRLTDWLLCGPHCAVRCKGPGIWDMLGCGRSRHSIMWQCLA